MHYQSRGVLPARERPARSQRPAQLGGRDVQGFSNMFRVHYSSIPISILPLIR